MIQQAMLQMEEEHRDLTGCHLLELDNITEIEGTLLSSQAPLCNIRSQAQAEPIAMFKHLQTK